MRVLERLSVRLLLAIVSGVAVMLTGEWWDTGWVPQLAVPGALFGAGVLWPHLRPGKLIALRAAAMLAFGGVSFWAALNTAVDLAPELGLSEGYEPNLPAFLLASVVGCAIVVVPTKWLAPLPTPLLYWGLTTLAALAGGVVIYLGLAVLENDAFEFAAFGAWHALLCLALHFGSRVSPA